LKALAHHVPEGLHDIAVVQDVVGKKVHQLVGIKFEDPLRAVPLGVLVCAVEHRAFLAVGHNGGAIQVESDRPAKSRLDSRLMIPGGFEQ